MGSQLSKLLAWLACAAVLVLAAVFLLHARPLHDDFNTGSIGLGGLWDHSVWKYTEWSGRWSGTGLAIVILAIVDPLTLYPPLMAALLLAELGAVVFLMRAAFGEAAGTVELSLGTLVFAALFWTGMPSPGSGLYWLTGNLENLLPLFLLAAAAALLLGQGAATGKRIALVCVLLFVGTGLHELFALTTLAFTVAGALAAHFGRAENRAAWVAAAATSAIGFAITYLAPGNAVRGETMPDGGNLDRTLELLLGELENRLLEWVTNPALLGATLLFLGATKLRAAPLPFTRVQHRTLGILLPLATLACVLAGLGGPGWATGHPSAPRTLNGTYLTFLFGWFATAALWSRPAAAELANAPRATAMLGTAGAWLLILGLTTSSNVKLGIWDWQDRLAPWSEAMDRRYELLEASREAGTLNVEIPTEPKKPRLQTVHDIDGDPYNGPNTFLAKYFGLARVRTADGDG